MLCQTNVQHSIFQLVFFGVVNNTYKGFVSIMANIIVRDINYVTTGKNQKFVSLDIGYSPDAFNLTFLSPEENVFDLDSLTLMGEGNDVILIPAEYNEDYLVKYLPYAYMPNMVYACSIEKDLDYYKDDTPDKGINNNLHSIFQTDGNNIIHNLYDIQDLAVKTNVNVVKDNFAELYGPSLDKQPLGIVQHGNYTYCMSDICNKTVNYEMTTLESKRTTLPMNIKDFSYKANISADDIFTYTYNPISMSSENMQDNYIPATNFQNMSCNYVFELQNNDKYNKYEDGDIYGDVFASKYAYDATYSMNQVKDKNEFDSEAIRREITAEVNGLPKNALINCRQYVGIGKCGDTLFLKYYDNIWYNQMQKDLSAINLSSIKPIEDDKYQNYSFNKYQKIETVQSINRFQSPAAHRSNLFSIKVNGTDLNSRVLTDLNSNNSEANKQLEKFRNQMMTDIQSNIKTFVKKICPAHTQLLNIEIT